MDVGEEENCNCDCDNCGEPPKPTAIPYGKLFFNWTSPKFSDWWLHTHIGDAITDENGIDGVYFDCCCGAPPGPRPLCLPLLPFHPPQRPACLCPAAPALALPHHQLPDAPPCPRVTPPREAAPAAAGGALGP